MRKLLIILSLAVLVLPVSAQRREKGSIVVDGLERTWNVFLPTTVKEGSALVMVLHGHGGKATPEPTFEFAAEKYGYAVVYPQGLDDSKKEPSWNVGYPFQKDMKVDDVKALCSIARAVQKKYRLSPYNAFLTGHSNGGEMCYLMAFSDQDVFRAVAPLSGLLMAWIYRTMEAPRPIPVFELHGSLDTTSSMDGDLTNEGGWGEYMPVPIAINYFSARDRCLREKCDTIPGLNPENGRFVVRHKFTDGVDGMENWLYVIVNGGHSWGTDDINTGEECWKFFSKYLK